MSETILSFLAILCFIYGISVMNAGTGSSFFMVWFALGLLLLAAGLGCHFDLWKHIPGLLRHLLLLCSFFLLILFLTVEGCILSQFASSEESNLDYIIVLGAHVTKKGPKPVLRYRLHKACGYLKENPDTLCILSGGQGKNEPLSEAESMRQYMLKRGISPSMLILEDQSMNTHQNLALSSNFFDKDRDHVGIVTNNFHVFRSIHLAKKLGIRHVCGIAAGSNPGFLPNNLLREFLAVCKDALIGNLR